MTALRKGSARVVAAVDAAARTLGCRPGMTVAHAQALVPRLTVAEATPEEDGEGLVRLAGWCFGYAPVVAPDPPDGIWIDIAGAAHLFGGEPALLSDLVGKLGTVGVTARAAVADTPGAAWAMARFSAQSVVAPGRIRDALAALPIRALRLAPEIVEGLSRLGLDTIGQLAAKDSKAITRRFRALPVHRLNQALGQEPEPIRPILPVAALQRRAAFAEPISAPESLRQVAADLTGALCRGLEARAEGARRLDLVFSRVDGLAQAVRVGTARPSRDPHHLVRLFAERLGHVDPGFGIEEAVIIATRVEPLQDRQLAAQAVGAGGLDPADLGGLIDRLAIRSRGAPYRLTPVESEMPERAVRKGRALAQPAALPEPASLPRPPMLIDPPEAVKGLAVFPEDMPALFEWRGERRWIVRADGPERITGEWWRSEDERTATRDYFWVEDRSGRRFWLFRDERGSWWIQGIWP